MMLVGSLGLVVVLMIRAADPETWRWIAPDQAAEEGSTEDPARIAQNQIEVPRKAVASDNGTEGEFRVVGNRPPATPYTLGGNHNGEAGQGHDKIWATPEALALVEDSSPFRASDFEAWSQVFDNMREANAQELSAKHAPLVQFGQLFQQSKLYRGKLVTIQGTIRRCVKLPPNPLDERAGNLWQLWVFSGGDNSPIVIYSMDLPEGFPVGNEIHETASLQAVYFKKWVYAAKGGTMSAPLLLAKNVNWQAPATVQREITGLEIAIGIGCTLLGAIGVVGFIWWANRNRDSQVEKLVRHRNRKQFEENAADISVGVSVRDQLGALSAQMKNHSSSEETDDKTTE
ncbi:hypothetical protein C5Y96_19815 [Blastopirellula marina]|uniref:Uncharacterized protein n=2 Tax=Pirellulales TaxID=2691354 RepID=A0A2S8F3L9_9BACT|nr:hypothetical protein C5Y96_19815 [Blastopirellula marina]RCS46212.1 hypothetical protein DTL36_19845 [Bremerella cremea]